MRPSLGQVNAEEVVSLAESGRGEASADGGVSVWMEDKLGLAAAELFERHGERLPWIAVTNGGLPAYLFSREFLGGDGKMGSFWRWVLFVACASITTALEWLDWLFQTGRFMEVGGVRFPVKYVFSLLSSSVGKNATA